jgi:hypothetical protein
MRAPMAGVSRSTHRVGSVTRVFLPLWIVPFRPRTQNGCEAQHSTPAPYRATGEGPCPDAADHAPHLIRCISLSCRDLRVSLSIALVSALISYFKRSRSSSRWSRARIAAPSESVLPPDCGALHVRPSHTCDISCTCHRGGRGGPALPGPAPHGGAAPVTFRRRGGAPHLASVSL